jgi:NADH-quinone oxidoreductase subunit C
MSHTSETLYSALQQRFADRPLHQALDEVTLEVPAAELLETCRALRDEFGFELLIDLCGVDYAAYGQADWETQASATGFSRGVSQAAQPGNPDFPQRFAVAYHLLSLQHNRRLRLRVFAEGDPPKVDSVIQIWNCADWFEREAFDLYGILFDGHPDLRRILTDYGFIGHPFRKDFPISGYVEMRYDPEQGRVIYEPVSIEPRILVPRVIRHDNRYQPQ